MSDWELAQSRSCRLLLGVCPIRDYVFLHVGTMGVSFSPDDARWLAEQLKRAAEHAEGKDGANELP